MIRKIMNKLSPTDQLIFKRIWFHGNIHSIGLAALAGFITYCASNGLYAATIIPVFSVLFLAQAPGIFMYMGMRKRNEPTEEEQLAEKKGDLRMIFKGKTICEHGIDVINSRCEPCYAVAVEEYKTAIEERSYIPTERLQ